MIFMNDRALGTSALRFRTPARRLGIPGAASVEHCNSRPSGQQDGLLGVFGSGPIVTLRDVRAGNRCIGRLIRAAIDFPSFGERSAPLLRAPQRFPRIVHQMRHFGIRIGKGGPEDFPMPARVLDPTQLSVGEDESLMSKRNHQTQIGLRRFHPELLSSPPLPEGSFLSLAKRADCLAVRHF